MVNEETYQKLVEMKLKGMAFSFQEHLTKPSQDDLSFEERFGLMVDREWTERWERRLKQRIKTAKLREQACLEDINYRLPRGLDRSVMQKLAACKWVAQHENIIITGATGVGKTWIACALANKACREGYTVLYARLPRLLHRMGIARVDGSYIKELSKMAKTQLLILDDWGLSPLGETERHDMLEILEDRHGLSSTIVTSQLPIKKWHDNVGDPTIADAVMDRLVHNAHRIELKGASVRKSTTEQSVAS